jgi:hypothetical protein
MPPEPTNPPPILIAPAMGNVPPPPIAPVAQSESGRQGLAIFLSLFLGLFLADAFVSLADDSLICFAKLLALTPFRMLLGLLATLGTLVLYVLMAFLPAIPKRLFVPLALFPLITTLLGLPFLVYHFQQAPLINWLTSLLQVIVGLAVLFRLRGADGFHWPLVSSRRLPPQQFRWRNLIVFISANLLVLLPSGLIYLFFCAGLAVNHFTAGFMTLHPDGFSVQARTYVRNDGKEIRLFPMAHVAEADFYQNISQTFPSNSIILMEGVTDEHNLLTNKISYKRMAQSFGLAEQHEKFAPTRGTMVRADIDIDQFSTNTLGLLNLVMLIHAKGVNANNVSTLVNFVPAADFQNELFADLLGKRNQHLLTEIQEHLPETETIIVPWGVAHMPGIAAAIQKNGFHWERSQDYTVIRFFHSAAKR